MIIGHKKQWEILKRALEAEKLPHAILFSGQEQLGKKTIAIEFAKFMNCSSTKKPCLSCRNCQDIEKGAYPDFILIKPESSNGEIQIAQIRELIRKLSLRSHSAQFKVAVIDKAHLMTKEAQNCFLKLLEEPRGKTFIVLITEFPETLLSTILSRTQKIRFFPVEVKKIKGYLISNGVQEEKAEKLSSIFLGKPGAAKDFLSNPERFKEQEAFVSDLIKISNSDFGFRFKYAKSLVDSKTELKDVLDVWTRHLRGVFLSRLAKKDFDKSPLLKLKRIISLIQNTKFSISTTNVNPKLALELLLMEI